MPNQTRSRSKTGLSVAFAFLLAFSLPMLAPTASAQGEDGTVTVTSPTNGQSVTYYTSSTPLTVSCSTSKTPQTDPQFGAAGMAFAIRQAGVGGFDFNQGWDSTSPYSVTRTMAQWGIANSGNHELRCRIYNGGVYYWATRTFNIVVATSGEDGSVTMTSPSNGASVTYYTGDTPLTISCSTSHTPQVDPQFGAAGMAFAVRQAGVGSYDFNQGWDASSPYSVTKTMAQWGIANSGSHEARCRVYENGLYYWSTRTFTIVIATSGEDGSVTMTSPGASVTYYTSDTLLTVSCSTSHTPAVDPQFGAAGMAFAVRQAGVGSYDFNQGWDSTSPYSVTKTMAQWGIASSGSHEARCRVYENGLYYWSTGTFNIVIATSGEDGSVTMTNPSNGASVSGSSVTVSCSTSHTPAVDPQFGAAGMAFAVRQAGVGAFDFNQGWDNTAPYSATRTLVQWGMTGPGSYEARCRVYENGLYYWSTSTFTVTTPDTPTGCTFTTISSGMQVSVTADTTCTSPYGNSIAYSWDWGDGTNAPNAGRTPTHTYSGAAFCPNGTPTITLTATATGPAATSTRNAAVADTTDLDPMPGGGVGDGVVACLEALQGTFDNNYDSDGDGLGNGIQATVGGVLRTVYSDFVESTLFPNRGTVFCNQASGCTAGQYPDPDHKDLYVEMDFMDVGYLPTSTGLDTIVASFANSPDAGNPDGTAGIRLHLDGGGAYFTHNLGGGNPVGFVDRLGEYCNDWRGFDAIKADPNQFAPARAGIFHYMIWANNQDESCNGSSGISHGIPGRDFLVTLGSFTGHGTDANRIGTFMHELGHNLGLRHGGSDDTHVKPNYLSIMSYAFQLDGIPRTAGANEFTYSSFQNALNLNERALDERVGLGDANAAAYRTMWSCPTGGTPRLAPATGSNGPLDWNCSGVDTDHPVRSNINGNAGRLDRADATCNAGNDAGCQDLRGSKDWGALIFSGIDPAYNPRGIDADLVTVPLPIDLPVVDPALGTVSEPDQGPDQYQPIHDLLAREGLLG